MQSIAFAEFFAGIGLMRPPLKPLGWRCVFANDIDPDKAETYRANFGANDLLVEDIKNVSAEQLPSDLTLITACFPCIDLSLAGNRAGLSGQDSGTFWERTWPFSSLDRLQDRAVPHSTQKPSGNVCCCYRTGHAAQPRVRRTRVVAATLGHTVTMNDWIS